MELYFRSTNIFTLDLDNAEIYYKKAMIYNFSRHLDFIWKGILISLTYNYILFGSYLTIFKKSDIADGKIFLRKKLLFSIIAQLSLFVLQHVIIQKLHTCVYFYVTLRSIAFSSLF